MAESITGTLGITYVDRPDDVYTAKTYAATATNAADAAKTAQTAAATSETNAKTSETNAASSASAANTSDTNAAASATTATSKASDAASSATAAKTSETNAKLSEESASSSASQASSYASGASTSASNAKDWAESTSSPDGNTDTASSTGSTQSAKSWALDAESSATTATSKASAAATSETNAKTSETNAATSETAAATSETNAKTSETNAAASKSSAATSATNAKTSETNSKTSETNAKTSENNAAASKDAAAASAANASTSETNSKYWAESSTSPDGLVDSDSSTGYTQSSKTWAQVAKTNAIGKNTFTGATSTSDGSTGLVPQPKTGEQEKFLKADGTWKKVQQRSIKEVIDIVHPVGSIWETTTTDDPNTLWAGTTWVKMDAGRVLVSAGSYTENGTTYTYNLGDKGGEAKHPLTIEELANHDHNISISTANLDGYLSTENTYKDNGPGHRDGGGIVQLEGKFDSYRTFGNSDADNLMGRNLHIAASHGHSATISTAGNNQPHENRMPYTVVNRWCRTA